MLPCHYCNEWFNYFGGEGWDCCDLKFCGQCETRHAEHCQEVPDGEAHSA